MTTPTDLDELPRAPDVFRPPWYRRVLGNSCGRGGWCRWSTYLALALLLLIPFLVGGCGATTENSSEGASIGFRADDGSIAVIPAEQRVAAPVISGTTLDGAAVTLSDYSGRVVVLNVWASWCGPCRSEAPLLAQAAEDNPGVQFLGLVTRDSQASAAAFAQRYSLDYPHLLDSDGALQLEFRDLPPKAIPSTVVIDQRGRIAARVLGEVHEGTLNGILEQVKG